MKTRRVLFVDDDAMLIRGLKRSAEEFLEDWDIEFVTSGMEAVKLFSKRSYDAIITDLRMPDMDGIQLLEFVRREYPFTMRFILSGNTKDAPMMQSIQLVHQIIPKPCDVEKMRVIVDRCFKLRDIFTDANLVKVITGISNLPSVPSVYVALLEYLQSEDPNPQDVGDLIAQDVAMTAKILHLVNSAFFGLPVQISSPQKAVHYLGINIIKSLALGIQIFSQYEINPLMPFSVDDLWNHSLCVGARMRAIAYKEGLPVQFQEDAQVAGFIHDVGKILLLKFPHFLQQLKVSRKKLSVDYEYHWFGTSHAEMGAYLLGLWGLPIQVVEAVAYHHKPWNIQVDKFSLIPILYIANGLQCMSEAQSDSIKDYLNLEYLQTIGLIDKLSEWIDISKG